MKTAQEFDALKRKVYLAYHQDGILDLAVAAVILGFGAFMATDSIVFLAIGAIFASQYVLMKRYITIPRFGYVRVIPQEKNLARLWFLVGLGVLMLLAFLILAVLTVNGSFPGARAWMQRYHMIPYSAVLFGLPALMAAVFLGLKRFYLYALLVVGFSALGAWVNITTFIPILATGLVLLAFGIGLLLSFLKKYPVNDKGADANG